MNEASRAEFEVLLRRTGVPVRAEHMADIQRGWELLRPLLGRLRQDECDFESEPAPVFRADAFTSKV